MTTTPVNIGETYELITSATDFTAQNRSGVDQEWVRESSLPADTVKGIKIPPGEGTRGSDGTGNLYGRTRYVSGGGLVVVFS